ncbi:hypothetical protein [Flavobacterium selenitireducens]|uniref:hypothetical protein n=1 Tax=Flavobacterium selenitireducens TaxID=2722704 RepID=UPI00168BA080|nr:hypothetical protein [Flavobacterium selenitireducens]MBD3581292.1 hypothetical protein [Flavobacterium selenitireducens]
MGALGAVATVAGLFGISERIIHHQNNFVRRFPHHVAFEKSKIDLVYNSYYFAGFENGKAYLGNSTTPLYITVVDLKTGILKKYQIKVDGNEVKLKAPRIRIRGDVFYLYEGSAPYIFRGSTKDWKGNLISNSGKRFTILEPTNTTNIALRFEKSGNGEGLLGRLNTEKTEDLYFAENLLEAQFDAFFDTDGCLTYDRKTARLIYTYFYRNQFIVASDDLTLEFRGNTIDTISKAQIHLATLKDGRKTFARPPLTVNRITAADGGLLFVNSMLPGQFENDALWKQASIVDVYDLKEQTYRSSFPIYHVNGKKMRAMLVDGTELYALIENQLVRYGLRENLKATTKNEKTGG